MFTLDNSISIVFVCGHAFDMKCISKNTIQACIINEIMKLCEEQCMSG